LLQIKRRCHLFEICSSVRYSIESCRDSLLQKVIQSFETGTLGTLFMHSKRLKRVPDYGNQFIHIIEYQSERTISLSCSISLGSRRHSAYNFAELSIKIRARLFLRVWTGLHNPDLVPGFTHYSLNLQNFSSRCAYKLALQIIATLIKSDTSQS
jgi:hypothetical protein